MNKTKNVLIILGILIMLIAPLMGSCLAELYLIIIGGMETEKYLLIIQGCINAFLIIGTITTIFGLFRKNNKEN